MNNRVNRRRTFESDLNQEDLLGSFNEVESQNSTKETEDLNPILKVNIDRIKQFKVSEDNGISYYNTLITTDSNNELKKPLNIVINNSTEILKKDVLRITIEEERLKNGNTEYIVGSYTHVFENLDKFGNSNPNEGYVRWLKNNCFGVGEVTAVSLVDYLNKNGSISELLGNKEVLRSFVKGKKDGGKPLSDEMIEDITSKWIGDKFRNELYAYLVKFKNNSTNKPVFNKNVINKIINKYSSNVKHILKTNPWILTKEISGVSFKTSDSIALKHGCKMDSEGRIDAAVEYTIRLMELDGGNCYVNIDDLVKRTSKEINLDEKIIKDYVLKTARDITGKNKLIDESEEAFIIDDNNIYRSETYNAELTVVKKIKKMLLKGPRISKEFAISLVDEVSANEGLKLDDSQYNAAITSLMYPVVVMTGGPGVGKSTIQKVVMNCIVKLNQTVSACCPTGKGARRQEETSGFKALTIHRQLEWHVPTESFRRNEYNKISADCIIVDEASMSDISLSSSQIKAIDDDAQIIYVGDINQIPSVGCGQYLKDLITSGLIPICVLNKTHRQASKSGIPVIAKRILEGDDLVESNDEELRGTHIIEVDDSDDINDKVVDILKHDLLPRGISLDRDVMILSPIKDGESGVHSLNRLIKFTFNNSEMGQTSSFGNKDFTIRDIVMQQKNNDEIQVSNGESGIVVGFYKDKSTNRKLPIVDFDGRKVFYNTDAISDLEIANSGTYHKAQGSEKTCTIIVCPDSASAKRLNSRNLFYTGATRAKSLLFVVGTKKSIRDAVDNILPERKTGLKSRLLNEIDYVKKVWENNGWDVEYFNKNQEIINEMKENESRILKKAEDRKNRGLNVKFRPQSKIPSFMKRVVKTPVEVENTIQNTNTNLSNSNPISINEQKNEDKVVENNITPNKPQERRAFIPRNAVRVKSVVEDVVLNNTTIQKKVFNKNQFNIQQKCNTSNNEPAKVEVIVDVVEKEIPIKREYQNNKKEDNKDISQVNNLNKDLIIEKTSDLKVSAFDIDDDKKNKYQKSFDL